MIPNGKRIGMEDNVNAAVTDGGKFGDAQDMWMQNLLNVGATERGVDDASTTSHLGDSLVGQQVGIESY